MDPDCVKRRQQVDSTYEQLKQSLEKYSSCPRLERMSIMSFAISLWTKKEVKTKIMDYFCGQKTQRQKRKKWREVEKQVLNQTKTIFLHHVLKHELEYAIATISVQILHWIKYLGRYTWSHATVPKDYINDIAWTMYGTIDKKKTFRLLLNNQTLRTNGSLFNLAYNFFLKTDIPVLWFEMSPHMQRLYEASKVPKAGTTDFQFSVLAQRILYKPFFPLNVIINNGVFALIVKSGHDLAIKYIWEAINTPAERREMIAKGWSTLRDHWKVDIFYFLLKHSSEKELKAMITGHSDYLLERLAFSNRPWQEYFLPLVSHLVEFVSAEELVALVHTILGRIGESGLRAIPIKRFLIALWKRSCDHVKEMVLARSTCRMSLLLSEANLDVLQLILREMSEAQVYRLMVSEHAKAMCFRIVINGEFDFDIFLGSIFRTRLFVADFKRELAIYGIKDVKTLLLGNKYEMFLKWCLASEEEMVRVKRKFCSYKFLEMTLPTFTVSENINVDRFFNWCLLPASDAMRLKQMVVKEEMLKKARVKAHVLKMVKKDLLNKDI